MCRGPSSKLQPLTRLLEQILSPDQMARVRVATVDQVAWEIVSERRKIGQLESDYDGDYFEEL